MLILTRKLGEIIRIQNNIQLVVVSINNSQVRLGIQAPREISIDREEIHQRKKNNLDNGTTETINSQRFYLGKNYPDIYFTSQEARCIKHLLNGLTYKEVGDILQLSPRTVIFYTSNMQAKLGCSSKKELITKVKSSDF